jgi:hypothetical protein
MGHTESVHEREPELGVITQAVSRRLRTAAARVRARVRSRGICSGQSGTEAGFLRALRFPPPPANRSTDSSSTLIITHHLQPLQ